MQVLGLRCCSLQLFAGDEPRVVFQSATTFHFQKEDREMTIIAIDLRKLNSMAYVHDTEAQEQQLKTLVTDRGYLRTLSDNYNSDLEFNQ